MYVEVEIFKRKVKLQSTAFLENIEVLAPNSGFLNDSINPFLHFRRNIELLGSKCLRMNSGKETGKIIWQFSNELRTLKKTFPSIFVVVVLVVVVLVVDVIADVVVVVALKDVTVVVVDVVVVVVVVDSNGAKENSNPNFPNFFVSV